ncbi:restriction endonuclease subunit S [Staphylococcus sp. GDX8P47P]|uniref:restriction endonuclease subunit S n=1 Tax=Staphylococcus sp. GDX8P47P TaxID=2804098 RepID=UPI001AEBF85B|nr:restriction endonuclease subunit S [Staphylococcus sp. GDX8P47P]
MTNKMKNVPELRFPEFIEEWEEKRLGDLYKYQQGQQIPVENQYKIQINNMKRFIRIVDVTENPKKRYIKDRKESGLINQKDLIMIRYGASAGTISMGYEGVIANNLFKFVKKQNVDNRYFYFLLKKSHFKIKSLSSQSAMPALNFNAMDTLKFSIPQYSEQQKIGSFFSKLDRQIELEELKLAKLEEQKKGYMQKIFSQELRFKDGSGNEYPEWEEVKLQNIANIKKGEQIKKENIDNNGKYYHLNGGTTASSRTNLFNTNPFTISISEGGNSCGFIKMNKEYFFSGGHNYTLLDLSVSNFYLYAYLKYHEKKIMSLRVGSGLPNIQKKDISNYLIKIPRKEEQEKIGSFFKNLDEFIEKQANKVELLKQRKQSFLQKMFV